MSQHSHSRQTNLTRRHLAFLLTLVAVLIAGSLVWVTQSQAADNAQNAQMVKDINLATKGALSYCSQDSCDEPYSNGYIARVGDTVFFTAEDATVGNELWMTDGTTTSLVADIMTGPEDSNPQDMTDVGGVLFFSADDGATSYELYKYDGVTVSLVKDIRPGPSSSSIHSTINVGGTLYFVADDGTHGSELWRSDGTEGGTKMIADINPGSGRSNPGNLALLGDTLLFSADDGTAGNELWKLDLTTDTVQMVEDIRPGSNPSRPNELVVADDKLFFTADDGNSGQELWVSDGTGDGTYLVQDLYPSTGSFNPGSQPFDLVAAGNYIYFPATHPDHGRELFRSDGTLDGIELVADIMAGNGGSDPSKLVHINRAIYFTANDGVHDTELWMHDTNSNTTNMMQDINPHSSGRVDQLTTVGDKLFFRASDGSNGEELWVTDGTTTTMLDIHPAGNSEPNFMVEGPGDALFFRADDGYHGHEMWVSDGTEDGTYIVDDLMTTPLGSDPQPLLEMNGRLFLTADDTTHGNELWVTDGTEQGTEPLKDINPALYGDSSANWLTHYDGKIFFSATDGVHGKELWVSDGTMAGTELFLDIFQGIDQWGGVGSSYPSYLTVVDDKLFFWANEGVNGRELWMSDGTVAGTMLLKDIRAGHFDSSVNDVTVYDNRLFWRASNGVDGEELWVSDGTPDGTYLLKDIQAGSGSGAPTPIVAVGDKLLFAANDGVNGKELWISDGTTDGTTMLKDIYPGDNGFGSANQSNPQNFAVLSDKLIFTANDGIHGKEVWVSDGTADGTQLLKDIREGEQFGQPASSNASRLTTVGEQVFFQAYDDVNGGELWVTDGTPDGTQLVKDLYPGIDQWSNLNSSYPEDLTNVDGVLYFTATDTHGRELWMSDGTEEGTVLVTDINLDDSSNPKYMTAINQRLVFMATSGSYDAAELWFVYLPVEASDDAYTLDAAPSLSVDVTMGVLTNDAGSSDAAATLDTGPSHGDVTLHLDGSFVYTPTAGYGGADQFTYILGNGGPYTDTATVTLTVTPPPSNECVATSSGNWSDVFPTCDPGAKYVIPEGVSVVLNEDVELDGDFELQGTLEPNGKTVTLTGSEEQTLTGDPLTFHDLVVLKDMRRDMVLINGKLEVANQLLVWRGRLRSASDYHHVLIDVEGILELTSDITVSGNWTNDGEFIANENVVTFDGATAQTVTGNQNTAFYDLEIAADADVTLDATPGITSTVLNNGTLRQTHVLNGSAGSAANFSFLQLGADKYQGVGITTESHLGQVTVAVAGNNASCAPYPVTFATRNRCYVVESGNGGVAAMMFYSTVEEDDITDDVLMQYVNSVWHELSPFCGAGDGAVCAAPEVSLQAGANAFVIGDPGNPTDNLNMLYLPSMMSHTSE